MEDLGGCDAMDQRRADPLVEPTLSFERKPSLPDTSKYP